MKVTRTELNKKLKKIKLLICDVDGVLTDGGVYLFNNGVEGKRFSVLDGAGCALAAGAGLKIAWLTARKSELVTLRAKECKVPFVLQGQKKKVPAFEKLIRENSLNPEEIAYIGDDLVDVPVLKKVGLAVSVSNGISEVKKIAHLITNRPGGGGAVREVIELILKAQHKWDATVRSFQGYDESEN